MGKLLKVNVQKKLKEFDLDVNFELKKRRLGILGPSGCGKSMTLKSIAGIVDPDDGIVSLDNGKETVPRNQLLLTGQNRVICHFLRLSPIREYNYHDWLKLIKLYPYRDEIGPAFAEV